MNTYFDCIVEPMCLPNINCKKNTDIDELGLSLTIKNKNFLCRLFNKDAYTALKILGIKKDRLYFSFKLIIDDVSLYLVKSHIEYDNTTIDILEKNFLDLLHLCIYAFNGSFSEHFYCAIPKDISKKLGIHSDVNILADPFSIKITEKSEKGNVIYPIFYDRNVSSNFNYKVLTDIKNTLIKIKEGEKHEFKSIL